MQSWLFWRWKILQRYEVVFKFCASIMILYWCSVFFVTLSDLISILLHCSVHISTPIVQTMMNAKLTASALLMQYARTNLELSNAFVRKVTMGMEKSAKVNISNSLFPLHLNSTFKIILYFRYKRMFPEEV